MHALHNVTSYGEFDWSLWLLVSLLMTKQPENDCMINLQLHTTFDDPIQQNEETITLPYITSQTLLCYVYLASAHFAHDCVTACIHFLYCLRHKD